jgi:HEAT repeat protein
VTKTALPDTHDPTTILAMLLRMERPADQYALLHHLVEHADQAFAQALQPLLQHPDGIVRSLAAKLILMADPIGGRPIVLDQLLDADHLVRVSAIEKLTPFQPTDQIVERLLPLLETTAHRDQQLFALEHIGRAGDTSIYAVLATFLQAPDRDLRYAAIEGVVRLGGDHGIAAMLPLLQDHDPLVRDRVCAVLSGFGSPQQTEILIGTLLHDSDPRVRMGAAHALGCIGDERALTALEWAADHDHVSTDDGYSTDVMAVRAGFQIARRYNLLFDDGELPSKSAE